MLQSVHVELCQQQLQPKNVGIEALTMNLFVAPATEGFSGKGDPPVREYPENERGQFPRGPVGVVT